MSERDPVWSNCLGCGKQYTGGSCFNCLKKFKGRKSVKDMSPDERAAEVMWIKDFKGAIPHRVIYERLVELVGREIDIIDEMFAPDAYEDLAQEVKDANGEAEKDK